MKAKIIKIERFIESCLYKQIVENIKKDSLINYNPLRLLDSKNEQNTTAKN